MHGYINVVQKCMTLSLASYNSINSGFYIVRPFTRIRLVMRPFTRLFPILAHTQFDAPEDSPNVRHYCLRIPESSEPVVHNCHFTNTSFCGSCVYVHGEGSRPIVSHCTIAKANNVGIFVDDRAQVRLLTSCK